MMCVLSVMNKNVRVKLRMKRCLCVCFVNSFGQGEGVPATCAFMLRAVARSRALSESFGTGQSG
jgi:hypothetical protein